MATIITGNVARSLRRYFLGVSYVAAFNAIVVGIGAYLLDVPLAGTIAVVVFVTAYVPFIGAFVSGAFAVMLALASQGTSTALVSGYLSIAWLIKWLGSHDLIGFAIYRVLVGLGLLAALFRGLL